MKRIANYRIHKYPLKVTDEQKVTIPYGAKILTVQVQNGTPCLWAEVDVDQVRQTKQPVFIVGTGHPMPAAAQQYLSTFQLEDGKLVFHVYLGDA